MRIVPREECIGTFRRNDLPSSRAHPSFICVGGVVDKDTCEGDGGSPHVCFNENNKYVLVGQHLIKDYNGHINCIGWCSFSW